MRSRRATDHRARRRHRRGQHAEPPIWAAFAYGGRVLLAVRSASTPSRQNDSQRTPAGPLDNKEASLCAVCCSPVPHQCRVQIGHSVPPTISASYEVSRPGSCGSNGASDCQVGQTPRTRSGPRGCTAPRAARWCLPRCARRASSRNAVPRGSHACRPWLAGSGRIAPLVDQRPVQP
jgi:hypothetical protein